MVSKEVDTIDSTRGKAYIAKVSSIISLITKMITFLLSFETRRVFLSVLGLEYLGLIQTLSQLLNALAVSELGIQAVITYMLYKPVAEGNKDQIEEYFSVYRILYRAIGVFILCVSLLMSPFLKVVITNVSISGATIWISWIIMACTSATSYFLSYNGAIIYAALKQYIYMLGDGIIRCALGIINLWTLFYFKNFYLYLIIMSISTIASGIMLLFMRKRMYPWIKNVKPSKDSFIRVYNSVKDLLWGRISGYIFNSTDNVIISAFIGTSAVAVLGNYSTVFWAVYMVFTSIIEPIQSIVGVFLVRADTKRTIVFLERYNYIVFIGGIVLFVPTALLASDFVALFYGDKYIVSWIIVALLLADFFVITMQTPVGMMLDAAGRFKEQKIMYMISVAINITASIIGVYSIGMAGVLLGTVIGRFYLWVSRAHLTFNYIIGGSEKRYWLSQIRKTGFFFAVITIVLFCFYFISTDASILLFIIKGVICEAVIMILNFIMYRNRDEFMYAVDLIKGRVH